ncbi:MAG: radical SAM family heme chaperone HemW [Oscillospiraceae bacterium]|nr:radical SAM family heme chaperone HemW [Oscillospiraceae bacterium]
MAFVAEERSRDVEKHLGIYFHIPFCARKCSYCDFYSLAGASGQMGAYQKALLTHLQESADRLDGYYIDTVYFGGGTPSFYGAARLIELLDALKRQGRLLVESEITAEVNPDSVTLPDLTRMRRAGFNRLSIGVQSTHDETLKKIGRIHSFAAAEKALKNAREARFENVSIDLMYGLPGQTMESWAEDLSRVAALKPDHISCYGLKLAEGTEMYVLKDSPFLPDDDLQADMYLYAVEYLARQGFIQYEISNFAKKGRESRHNMKYWTGQEYLGFGAAAHSFIGRTRFRNVPDAAAYCRAMREGSPLIDQIESIDAFGLAGEYLMLGLRTTRGISEDEYRRIYPSDFSGIEERLKAFEHYGWAVNPNGRWRLTPKGFLISNVLIGQVLDAQSSQVQSAPEPAAPEDLSSLVENAVSLTQSEADAMFRGI